MQPQVPMEYGMGIDRVAYNALLYEAVSLYHSMVEDEESAYLIALAYHDLIISAVDYAYQDDGITPEEGAWAHSAIGVFLGMDVVCEGYAKAFQLLLNVSGVENVFVVGIAGGPHAWNLVRLDDGAWYWFDLTWDDNDAAFNDVSYHYFAVTDESVVDWLDAHLGAQTPHAGSLSFLEDHRPYSAMGESYALPERSDTPLSLEGVLELRPSDTSSLWRVTVIRLKGDCAFVQTVPSVFCKRSCVPKGLA